MSVEIINNSLMEILMAYQKTSKAFERDELADKSAADALLARLEHRLIDAECQSAEDLVAKALYLQDTVRLDSGLVTSRVVDTLVAGIQRFAATTAGVVGG